MFTVRHSLIFLLFCKEGIRKRPLGQSKKWQKLWQKRTNTRSVRQRRELQLQGGNLGLLEGQAGLCRRLPHDRRRLIARPLVHFVEASPGEWVNGRQGEFESFEKVVWERDGDVEAVREQDDPAEVVDGGLDDSDVDEVEQHRNDLPRTVWKLEGLDFLPVIAL